MRIEFHENNSGGYLRLKESQYDALRSAGWVVQGLYATSPHVASEAVAVAMWEAATNEYSTEKGCRCCGKPFDFTSLSVKEAAEFESAQPDPHAARDRMQAAALVLACAFLEMLAGMVHGNFDVILAADVINYAIPGWDTLQ